MAEIRRCPEHGVFDGSDCPNCGGTGPVVVGPERRVRLSKLVSGALRHFPDELDLDVDDAGWVDLEELVAAVRERHAWADGTTVRALARADPKGRYEVADDRIRATYGHSIEVTLPDADGDVPDLLYHGTDPANLDQIRERGIAPMDRQEVHLSATVEDALAVGRRHCDDPAVLEVDAAALGDAGVRVRERGDDVFTAPQVPWRFCRVVRS